MLDRRRYLRGLGATPLVAGLAGCISETDASDDGGESGSTATPAGRTPVRPEESEFPDYSGTVTISGDDDFWALELELSTAARLEYTVTNRKSEDHDFDVFVFPDRTEYDRYVTRVRDSGSEADSVAEASIEGVRASKTVATRLDAGTYYFVVDNTDIGDAGDWGSEETRNVEVDLTTAEPGDPTTTPVSDDTPAATPTSATRHAVGESFTVGTGDKALRYVVEPADNLYESVGQAEANGIFLVLNLTIENVGDETITLTTDMFTLVNEDGQEYDVDTEAMLMMEKSLAFEDITPGTTLEGSVPFDIHASGSHAYALVIEPAGTLSLAEDHIVDVAEVNL